MIPGRTAAFSLEKIPTAWAISMAAIQSNLRRPRAVALFT
jgi:hypothetical protein